MKIWKYLIFLSILSTIFLVIYRKSNKKGFSRLALSFRIAVFFAAVLSGLISVKGFEYLENNHPGYLFRSETAIMCSTGKGSNSVPTVPGRNNYQPIKSPRPNRNVFLQPYPRAPKLVPELPGAPRGAGGGGGPSGSGSGKSNNNDTNDKVPKNQGKNRKSKKLKTLNYDSYPNASKDKKKSDDECPSDENPSITINEKFNSTSVKRLIDTALRNQDVQREYRTVKKRIQQGVRPIDIGKKSTNLPNNKVLIKGSHGRYVVEVSGKNINILGIGDRGNRRNMLSLKRLMREMYNINLQY